jgi:hypothetical protein
MNAHRVLITGSRDWDDHDLIEQQLWHHSNADTVLVTGACPTGADHIAETIWNDWALPIERHPAHWHRDGKRAGYIRNAHMVHLGADICLAFIRGNSRGASMTAHLAEQAGIEVRRFEVTA